MISNNPTESSALVLKTTNLWRLVLRQPSYGHSEEGYSVKTIDKDFYLSTINNLYNVVENYKKFNGKPPTTARNWIHEGG